MNKFEYLPKEIIKSTELTPAEKLIYLHLFHIIGWGEDRTINITHLSEKLGISIRTVRAAINTKLQELDYILISQDKTITVFLNGIEIKDKIFYKSKQAMNMLGDFIKVPTQFLYDTNLTPAERLVEMVLFDFYFTIDKKGNFKNKSNVVFKSVATMYNMSEKTINEHLRNIKAKGAIDYTVHTSKGRSKIYGFKFFKQETISVYLNGKKQKSENTIVETKEQLITPEQKLEEELFGKELEVPEETEEQKEIIKAMYDKLSDYWKKDYDYKYEYATYEQKIKYLSLHQS